MHVPFTLNAYEVKKYLFLVLKTFQTGEEWLSILESYLLSFPRYSSFCAKIDDFTNCPHDCNKSQNFLYVLANLKTKLPQIGDNQRNVDVGFQITVMVISSPKLNLPKMV